MSFLMGNPSWAAAAKFGHSRYAHDPLTEFMSSRCFTVTQKYLGLDTAGAQNLSVGRIVGVTGNWTRLQTQSYRNGGCSCRSRPPSHSRESQSADPALAYCGATVALPHPEGWVGRRVTFLGQCANILASCWRTFAVRARSGQSEMS
ncbi:hypothetical protein BGY98DRAFT_1161485 [Russula aff. rugulosa BPL654]|nr:hypothetical protein BGY98DRAFT_1161485 [Russula aff. rugulosa BPL654]